MDRRYWSMILIALIGSTVNAQDTAAHNAGFSVVGDLSHPQTLQFDAAARVDVQTLLQHAQPASAGVATIIRGPGAWQVVAEQFLSGEPGIAALPVLPGDIVVYRSSNGRIPDHANALVVFADGRAELPLPDGTCTVQQLLDQLHVSARPVSVVRSDRSSASVLTLQAQDRLLHCDVIDLSDVAARQLQQTAAFLHAPNVGAEGADGLLVPDLSTVSNSSAGEQVDSDGPSAAAPVILPSLDLQLPGAAQDPEEGPSKVSEGDAAFRVASLSSVLADTATAGSAVPISAAAPGEAVAAGPEIDEAASGLGSSLVMDTIFIAGLLFAMGLILVGWARMKREQELDDGINQGLRRSLANQNNSPAAEPETSQSTDASDAVAAPNINPNINHVAASSGAVEHHLPQQPEDPLISHGAEWFAAADEPEVVSVSDQPISATTTESPAGDLLDELIEDRLPAKLEPTHLPLRVSLFGRPQGPQRLRIDAAHHQIAAPHMAKRNRSASAPRQKVVAASPATRQEAATEADGAVDLSRLDRALNSLKEQGER